METTETPTRCSAGATTPTLKVRCEREAGHPGSHRMTLEGGGTITW